MRTFYALLGLTLTWVACAKHDKKLPPANNTPAYLAKIVSPDEADSTVFLYTQDTVLRCFAQEYSWVGTPVVNGYFPVYVNARFGALNKGGDTLGTTATQYFNFLPDGAGRIQLAVHQGTNPYYDSLSYDASGHLAAIYEYYGPPNGVRYISWVGQLTWDAAGDVTQYQESDNPADLQAGKVTYVATLTYDGRVNPYRKTQGGLLLALVRDQDYFLYLSAQNLATAQIVEYDLASGSQASESDTDTYTYDGAGNPLTLAHAVTIQGSIVTTHQVFTYVH